MKYYEDKDITLYHGKMQDELKNLPDESIDSIVCDPPYELNFMNKGWDNSGVAFNKDTWKECYRVLKKGGHLLAFGGSRTYHRIAVAIEDAGFEIRDCIMWLYGSGFPKSHNVGLDVDKINGVESKVIGSYDAPDTHDIGVKQKELGNGSVLSFGQIENAERIQYQVKQAQNEWAGYGTALKPAYEPIVMARKPMNLTVAQNCLTYGVGAINIDECRVGNDTIKGGTTQMYKDNGRFPANVITDGSDEVGVGMPDTKSEGGCSMKQSMFGLTQQINDYNFHDFGSTMRYFYQAKASKKDRDDGLIEFEEKQRTDGCIRTNSESAREFGANSSVSRNIHPTVKPVELMQYLVRLVSPKGSTILDCFMGSGSTGKAVMFENRERQANYKFIGVEMTDEYLPIAKARILYGRDIFEYEMKKMEKTTGQLSLDLWGDEK